MARKRPIPESWISWGWDTVPGQDFFVSHVAEMCPGAPLNPKQSNITPFWTLDYSFTPSRIKVDNEPWEEKTPYVGYLIPRFKPWHEGPSRLWRGQPRRCVLSFAVQMALGFDKRYWQASPTGYSKFLDPDRVLANTMTRIAGTAQALGSEGYWTVHAMVVDLIRALMALEPVHLGVYEVRADSLRKPVDPVVSRATSYLQEHMAEAIGVRDVARNLKMGESTLSHHFKKAKAGSPMKLLQSLRIQRVKALLVQGHKLEAIAGITGFCNGLYLSRIFKQVTGISPSDYRLQLGKNH